MFMKSTVLYSQSSISGYWRLPECPFTYRGYPPIEGANEIAGKNIQITVNHLPAGMYLLRLMGSESAPLSTQKIIIKN